MLPIPKRETLITQTVNALREGITSGLWKTYLPAERELCRRLQVSRPTLRSAIEVIAREGLIAVHQGKRSAILKRKSAQPSSTKKSVALISKWPLHSLSRNRIFLINYLQEVLLDQGLRLEVVSHPAFGMNNPKRAIQHLQDRGDYKAFVLVLSSRAVQEWFCDHSLPSLVLGSAFPGLRLPSVDSDYPSIGHHAAGLLLGKSHRNIVCVMPEISSAGDLETEENFLNALHQSKHKTQCRMIRYDTSSKELIKKVQKLLDSSQPPTAFFVISAQATVALVTYLLSRGIRIPQDVSIISRDYDPILEWFFPQVAHYVFPLKTMATKITRIVMELASNGAPPLRHTRIMPQFNAAESLAVAPDSKSA